MRVGLFELVDPPDGQAATFRQTLAQINYPWARLIPRLRRDADRAVVVRWVSFGGNRYGLYVDRSVEIHLRHGASGYYVAHELGHLVDNLTFNESHRRDLLDAMGAPSRTWRPGNSVTYLARPNEAYADLFVEAFAPTLWAGRSRRFLLQAPVDVVRDVTLRSPIMVFADVDGVHRDAVEWAAGEGLIEGFDDGTFRPGEPVTRGQLATILRRFAIGR